MRPLLGREDARSEQHYNTATLRGAIKGGEASQHRVSPRHILESLPNTCRSDLANSPSLHHAASSASLGSTRLATKSTASFGLQACAVTPAWPRWGHSDRSRSSSARAFAAPSCELGGTKRKTSSAEHRKPWVAAYIVIPRASRPAVANPTTASLGLLGDNAVFSHPLLSGSVLYRFSYSGHIIGGASNEILSGPPIKLAMG